MNPAQQGQVKGNPPEIDRKARHGRNGKVLISVDPMNRGPQGAPLLRVMGGGDPMNRACPRGELAQPKE